jgi:prephenate dehydrogenase
MNITIIGLGVIGGSLGLAIKQNIPSAVVTGYDADPVIEKALNLNAVDFGAASLPSAVADADIVFLCLPVSGILSMLPRIAPHLRPGAVVTDVGSTKQDIVNAAKRCITAPAMFIGGHPMAGSEGKGIDFADPLLFQNATYVLCVNPVKRTKTASLTTLLHRIGARVLFLSAKDHDTVAAMISHLPQLLAVAMMNIVEKKSRRNPAYLQLAAGGFRDMTRIASSPYEMWKDILSHNSKEITGVVREFRRLLEKFEHDLTFSQNAFAGRFVHAKQLRDAIPKNSKGFLHPLYDLLISVDDRSGVLAAITGSLSRAGINIKDIELLKIRDGRGGTFRISFDTRKDARRAENVLKKIAITIL